MTTRSKVILPVDASPPGQAMDVATYNLNGVDTVAANAAFLVDTEGAATKVATETTLDTIAQLLRTQNALLQGIQLQLAVISGGNLNMIDTTVFLDKEI